MPTSGFPRAWMFGLVLVPLTGFAATTWGVLGGTRLPEFDNQVALYWKEVAHEQPCLRGLMIAFTYSGGIPALIALTLLGAAWQWGRGRWPLALSWISIVLGGALLNLALKVAFDRTRPPDPDPVVTEKNESFPSGHSMGGLIGYGMVAYVVCLTSWRRFTKAGLVLGLVLLVGCIGWSRMFLRAHWCSDVLGGFAIGLAWLALSLTWLERRRFSQEGDCPV